MKIAIDISPLEDNPRLLQHRVRGTGLYIENLRRSLPRHYPHNKYTFFTQGEKLPKDINLVHYPYFEPFFLTLPLFKKYKTVVTVHDLTPFVFPQHFPAGVKGKIKWQLQKMALWKADAIITDSQSSKKDIMKFVGVPSKKVHVVYLAPAPEFRKLGIENWKLKIKQKYQLPDIFVLYVGDVTWNKNLPRLIEAIKKINLTLVMVGKALVDREFDRNNPWNQDLVKVQDLVKDDRHIIRLGFVETEDLIALYNAATVLTMPSLYEGFGLPILEAMSCGCPVVTTKEGSLPEIAGEAVFYVDACDTDNIAKGISEVFFDEKLRQVLSRKGLTQASRFSWEKTTKETMEVYEETA